MLYISQFSDNEIRKPIYKKRYAIVNSYRHPSALFTRLPIIAPSTDLFYKCQKVKQTKNWNEDTFQKIYIPNFLKQLHGKKERQTLAWLYEQSKTENIVLACFCHDEAHCHRSVVAGLMQGAGACVALPTNTDYSKYWSMYNDPQYWADASLHEIT